jgi:hypothetical protein
MEDSDGLILAIFLIIVVVALFIGAKTFLSKAVGTMPTNSIDSTDTLRNQRERMRSVKEQHDRMMQMQQQRIRDAKRY